ncbi:MAG: bacterioferritin [Burkholderiaceae bacterium]|nr:bacterioferritin [Burkholderiaceae bacterium]
MPHKSTARARSSTTGSAPASAGESTPFVQDVEALRRRARENMECGAITQSYGADRQAVVDVLNAALATELVCVLRYKRHYFMAQGIASESVKSEFLEHANEEQGHADKLCERIVQLGGEPDLDPQTLSARSHSQYVEGKDLVDMIREDLVAERIAIDSYREIVQWLADKDPSSRRVMEEILANEEEHAEDLGSMLQGMGLSGIDASASGSRPSAGNGSTAR